MGHSQSLFLYFCLFYCKIDRQNFADVWIQTVDLWCQKQRLYQLSHNHCPKRPTYLHCDLIVYFLMSNLFFVSLLTVPSKFEVFQNVIHRHQKCFQKIESHVRDFVFAFI